MRGDGCRPFHSRLTDDEDIARSARWPLSARAEARMPRLPEAEAYSPFRTSRLAYFHFIIQRHIPRELRTEKQIIAACRPSPRLRSFDARTT